MGESMWVCVGPGESGRAMYSACRIRRAELERISASAGTFFDETSQLVPLCPSQTLGAAQARASMRQVCRCVRGPCGHSRHLMSWLGRQRGTLRPPRWPNVAVGLGYPRPAVTAHVFVFV